MRIVGHGIDLVEVPRIADLVTRHGERFLQRCFTADEIAYCRRGRKRFHEHLAARFAAKEAVLKALGTGRRHGITWTDVAVVRLPTGEPTVQLANVAADVARARGVVTWHLSLTHVTGIAAASVVAVGESVDGPLTR